MLNVLLSIYFFSLTLVFVKFLLNREHLLVSLLCLEFLSMIFYFMLIFLMVVKGSELFYVVYFISIVVCEGCLGLSLLVLISYYYGGDKLSTISFLMC